MIATTAPSNGTHHLPRSWVNPVVLTVQSMYPEVYSRYETAGFAVGTLARWNGKANIELIA